ncbi:MAG: hypothetical protein KC519_17985, partial [Anaerolineae bacterium]|nr:hypothetical protein [Anaerolineae bacterium]
RLTKARTLAVSECDFKQLENLYVDAALELEKSLGNSHRVVDILLSLFKLNTPKSMVERTNQVAEYLIQHKIAALKSIGQEHPFLSALHQRMYGIESQISQGRIEVNTRPESLLMLVTMVESAHRTVDAINYYMGTWQKRLKDYFEANIQAVKRGVKVRRVFILRPENSAYQQRDFPHYTGTEIYEEMQRHAAKGIEVYYVEEADAKEHIYGDLQPFGLVLCDESVLLKVNAKPGADPTEIHVYWKSEAVNNQNLFRKIFDPGNQKYVKPFSPDDEALARQLRGS